MRAPERLQSFFLSFSLYSSFNPAALAKLADLPEKAFVELSAQPARPDPKPLACPVFCERVQVFWGELDCDRSTWQAITLCASYVTLRERERSGDVMLSLDFGCMDGALNLRMPLTPNLISNLASNNRPSQWPNTVRCMQGRAVRAPHCHRLIFSRSAKRHLCLTFNLLAFALSGARPFTRVNADRLFFTWYVRGPSWAGEAREMRCPCRYLHFFRDVVLPMSLPTRRHTLVRDCINS